MDHEVCGHCGNLPHECEDPDRPWYPQRDIDYAEMALSAANWLLDQRHQGKSGIGEYHDGSFENWSHTRSSTHPFHYRDGVHLWVSKYDLTPDANWI